MLYKNETYNQKHLLIDISVICLLGLLFILSGVTLTRFNGEKSKIDDILGNWQSHLIYDIEQKRTKCEENTTELIFGNWSGTISGCDCLGVNSGISSSYQNKLFANECPNSVKGKCKSVEPIGEKPLDTWQSNSLCIQSKNRTYYDYIRQAVAWNETCPYNTIQCGILDSLSNKLCLKGRACPVNDIVLSGYKTPLNFNYEEIRMRENYYLFYTRLGFNEKIPVQFNLSQGKICIDPDERNLFGNRYILDNDTKKDNCTVQEDFILYDTRYRKVDSMSTMNLYEQNGFYNLIENLPDYPESQLTELTSLFTRSFIGWNVNCLNNVHTTPENLRDVNDLTYRLDAFNIAQFVIIGAAILYMGLIGFILKKKYETNVQNVNLITGFSFVFFLAIFGISLYLVLSVEEIDVDLFSCGDSITSSFLLPLQEKLRYIRIFYYIIVVLSICCILVYLIMYMVSDFRYKSELRAKRKLLEKEERERERERQRELERQRAMEKMNQLPVENKEDQTEPDEILKINSRQEKERRRRLEEELRRKKIEEEERRKKRLEEEQRNKRREEERRRHLHDEEERLKSLQAEELRKRLEMEEALKKKLDEENRLRMIEEQKQRRLKFEQEEKKRLEEKNRQKELERKRKLEEEEKKKKKEEEDKWGGNDIEDDGKGNIIEYK